MHTHKTDYNFGDIVYLETDPDQHQRMITRIILSRGSVVYELGFGSDVSNHYGFEFSFNPNISLKLGIIQNEVNK